ncbi:hypothetical protein ACIA2T_27540 [Amycolatopsis japonica]
MAIDFPAWGRLPFRGDGGAKLVRFWIMRLPPPSSIFGNGSR